MTTAEPGSDALRQRLREAGRDIVQSQRALLESALGQVPERPALLIERLGLDKTLASKLVRGLHAQEPLQALHGLPAPKGLGLAIDAAERNGADPMLALAARETSGRLAALQDDFAGGRVGLLAVLSGWLPETREREDRHARQAAFRALSTIGGTRLDALYNAYVYAPSAQDPDACDTAGVFLRQGLRRLRHGSSMRITAVSGDEEQRDVARRTTLEGEAIAGDPMRILVPEFCSDPLPELALHHDLDRVDLVLGARSPALDDSADLCFGMFNRGLVPRYRGDDRRWEFTLQAPNRPAAVMVCDLLIHRDLFGSRSPVVTTQFGLTMPTVDGPYADQPDQLGEAVECPLLGYGLENAHTDDVRDVPRLLAHTFGRIGLDPMQFRVHRYRLAYPAPSLALLFWIELPERG